MKLARPDQKTLHALARFAKSNEGQTIVAWLESNAEVLLQGSLDHTSDARSRQLQGAWSIVKDFINQTEGAHVVLGQQEPQR